jgi:hypothetical protein
MNQTAGIIHSNLRRSTQSYDEDLAVSAEQRAAIAAMPRADDSHPEMWEIEQEAWEIAYNAAAPHRWKGQKRWMGRENEEMRLVNILTPVGFFRKLQQAGVDARTEAPSYYVMDIDHKTGKIVQMKRERTAGRLWLHDHNIAGRVGVSAWVWNAKKGIRERRCVTSLQDGCGPEWSLMHFDQYDVPVTERYRGWRTALLMLITKGVITEDEADRAFGPPILNAASELYREQLSDYRRLRMGLTQ